MVICERRIEHYSTSSVDTAANKFPESQFGFSQLLITNI